MKTLNLDALAPAKRSITIAGESYDVLEMTVGNFIETSRAAARMDNPDISVEEQIGAAIDLIHRCIPGCPLEKLHALTMEQLGMLSRFIRGEIHNEAAENGMTEEKKP